MWYRDSPDLRNKPVPIGIGAPHRGNTAHIPAIYVRADGRLRVGMFWNDVLTPITSVGTVNDRAFHHVAVVFTGTNLDVDLDGSRLRKSRDAPRFLR
jgi:hypothetical protein